MSIRLLERSHFSTLIFISRPCVSEDFPHTWKSEEVAKIWRKQASQDWSNMLMLRGRELVPGMFVSFI